MEFHPSLDDLTRAAYDLGPSPDHVFWCGTCLEVLERMREERIILTQRPSRPAPPSSLGAFFSRLFARSR